MVGGRISIFASFFITAELLLAFGVVKFLGILFEPIMRPLFNIPGAGSFGWIMGMASGYPTGAKIAARLREEKQVTQIEAERLVSFTNNSSPLFIFGAISAGFFIILNWDFYWLCVIMELIRSSGSLCVFMGESRKSRLPNKRDSPFR